jgi:hypothetical protein
MAIKMIVLSMLALMAHFCMFEAVMREDPLTYLLHLLYFRSKSCDAEVNWENLRIVGNLNNTTAELSGQSMAVTRTFTFAILYTAFNTLLSLAAVASLRELEIAGM